MSTPRQFDIESIATISTPFKEKFGIPRQPNLTRAKGTITFCGDEIGWDAIKDLKQHSHLWLLFMFDQHLARGWNSLVRPPRLGGNSKVGVLATRSTFRPNPIGMSVVKLIDIVEVDRKPRIIVEGIDLLDGTPIIDIKPYIPYSDSVPEASSDFAPEAPLNTLTVRYSDTAKNKIDSFAIDSQLVELFNDVLQQDPRPAYKKATIDPKVYGISLDKYNIKWQVQLEEADEADSPSEICEVLDIELA